MSNTPQISVIIISPSKVNALRCVLHYIRRQTVAKQLELIVMVSPTVVQDLEDTETPLLRETLANVQILPLDDIALIGKARAMTVAAASSNIVVFQEEHCFPASDWAEKLIEGFRLHGPAIGTRMHIANPETLTSKVAFCMTYGQWSPFEPEGVKADIAGHNSCYGRETLLSFRDDLAELLDNPHSLHQALRQKGHELYFYSPAHNYHVNISSTKEFLKEFLSMATLHPASWRKKKSVLQRLFFLVRNTLMPIRQIRWSWQDMGRNRLSLREKLCALPLCIASAFLTGVGTFYGLWFSTDFAFHMKIKVEYQRESLLCPADHERYTTDGHWNPAAWENIIP